MSNEKSKEILDLYAAKVMPTYAPTVAIASGKGLTVRDADGRSYYDFTSGIGVQAVGHAHPKVTAAIQAQAAALTHCSNLFANAPETLLADKLVELSGLGGKVFFCNSGAEANEAAIKLARRWGRANGGRYEVVTFRQGFHGRTLATVAATAQAWCQDGYDPLPVGFAYADYNDLDSLRAAIGDKTVAVMLEAVQGEGGVTPATEEFMKGVRAVCDEKNLLMVVDEVQSGMGRTGKWFAWQNYGVEPDMFTCAKALGGGLPMGALVSSAKLADVFAVSSHASTFGGNPVAAAAANAVISVIEEEGLLENAAKVGTLLRETLQGFVDQYDRLLEVRGSGLMLGLVVDGEAKDVVDALAGQGLLALTAGRNVVRFLPPLCLGEDDLEDAADMMSDAFAGLYGGRMNFVQRHAYDFGFALGACVWPFLVRRRRIAAENVLRAGVAGDMKAARRIARRSFCHFVGHVGEALFVPSVVNRGNYLEHLDFSGAPEEQVRLLLEQTDRPVILASAHHGVWEAATNVISFARPMIAIARVPDNPLLARWMAKHHFRGPVTLVDKNHGFTREVVRQWLDANAALTILMDQHAGSGGAPLRFFGRPARTHTTAVRMAKRTGCPIVVGSFVRTGPYRYRLVATGGPISVSAADDSDSVAQLLNDRLEAAIRQYPEQYLWVHRRWRDD